MAGRVGPGQTASPGSDIDGYPDARDGRHFSHPDLRQDAVTQDITVVALTANAMPGDREKILEAGCQDYISKPFRLHEFLEKIREYLPEDPE